jgi:hypothetical protein
MNTHNFVNVWIESSHSGVANTVRLYWPVPSVYLDKELHGCRDTLYQYMKIAQEICGLAAGYDKKSIKRGSSFTSDGGSLLHLDHIELLCGGFLDGRGGWTGGWQSPTAASEIVKGGPGIATSRPGRNEGGRRPSGGNSG